MGKIDIDDQYKAFLKSVKPLMTEHGIKGIVIEYSGSGDEGCIDTVDYIVSGQRRKNLSKKPAHTDTRGMEIPPHPWTHTGETYCESAEETDALLVKGVSTFKETYTPGKGWETVETIQDLQLGEVVRSFAYNLMEEWYGDWEVNCGSRGTLWLYPKNVEYEHIVEFEDYDELQRGYEYYSGCLPAIYLDEYDQFQGFRGRYVEDELDPIDDDSDTW